MERLLDHRATDQKLEVVRHGTTDLDEQQAANEPTVVNLVNQILSEAIIAGATDVHFEPFESKFRVRYRIDGILEDVAVPASVHQLRQAVISRVKIMSNLDISEKRLPQDGRAQVSSLDREYDLRISVLPGVFGEAVVIRIQNRHVVKLELDQLGYDEVDRKTIWELINRPHGLVLVTGPTGSGKTTTLYTCLSTIRSPATKIITIEDPVEYWMEDIVQMQVHEVIGFTFARALRGMLRHDPDIMLVGEIRDRETADIGIRSSLTGHLVFATLHTNDAATAVTRMIDIGVESFLLASSLCGVLAQRLVRRLCPHCRKSLDLKKVENGRLVMMQAAFTPDQLACLKLGAGCERCRFTGFRGRIAIAEILVLDPEIRALVQERAPRRQN